MANMLASYLVNSGYKVFVSKELSTPMGKYILDSFSDDAPKLTPSMKTLLFAADRLKRYEDLSNGDFDIVIWDRYVLSAIVYRKMEELDEEWVHRVNSKFPKADLIFYLDVDIEEAIQRGKERRPYPYSKKQLNSCLSLYHQFSELGIGELSIDELGTFISVPQMDQDGAMNIILKRIQDEIELKRI